MNQRIVFFIFIFGFLFSCKHNNDPKTSKEFRVSQAKTINTEDGIHEVNTNLFLSYGEFSLLDDYLIYNEYDPKGQKGIHLFDRKTLSYIKSTGQLGRGPGEITRLGENSIDPKNNIFWASDYGKQVRWKFPIDSVLRSDIFLPQEKIKLPKDYFVKNYKYLTPNEGLGIAIKPLSNFSMEMELAKIDISSNNSENFGYNHPGLEGKETYFDFELSKDKSIYAKAFNNVDLLTICDEKGELITNIYGPNWGKDDELKRYYFPKVQFFKDLILTSYLGSKRIIVEEGQPPKIFNPTKLLVFDKKGNLLKVVETGQQFTSFITDEKNERIIFYFEDKTNPLGYINFNPDMIT